MITEVSSPAAPKASVSKRVHITRRAVSFFVVCVALILGGVIRSSVATRLDSFTIDEPWHIDAGIHTLRVRRLPTEPEHPPTQKLWVGRRVRIKVRLPPFRPILRQV